jgi:putative transposase
MSTIEDKSSEQIDKSGASAPPKNVISIDEGVIREHLDEVVTRTVKTTLNALLEAEADQLCGARRYEHSADRVAATSGSCTPRQGK